MFKAVFFKTNPYSYNHTSVYYHVQQKYCISEMETILRKTTGIKLNYVIVNIGEIGISLSASQKSTGVKDPFLGCQCFHRIVFIEVNV